MTRELAGVAADVAAAARRFGFRRRGTSHPVENLEDAEVGIAGAGTSFLELGGMPSLEAQAALVRSLQMRLDMAHDKAQGAMVLGRWLVTESQGPQPGFSRLVRKIFKMRGQAGFAPLMQVLRDLAEFAAPRSPPVRARRWTRSRSSFGCSGEATAPGRRDFCHGGEIFRRKIVILAEPTIFLRKICHPPPEICCGSWQ